MNFQELVEDRREADRMIVENSVNGGPNLTLPGLLWHSLSRPAQTIQPSAKFVGRL
jgi:hypothetical protein